MRNLSQEATLISNICFKFCKKYMKKFQKEDHNSKNFEVFLIVECNVI